MRLRGWITHSPAQRCGYSQRRPTCNQCWGDNLERNGTILAHVRSPYVLWRCADCGANVKGTMHSRAAVSQWCIMTRDHDQPTPDWTPEPRLWCGFCCTSALTCGCPHGDLVTDEHFRAIEEAHIVRGAE